VTKILGGSRTRCASYRGSVDRLEPLVPAPLDMTVIQLLLCRLSAERCAKPLEDDASDKARVNDVDVCVCVCVCVSGARGAEEDRTKQC